MTGVIIDVTPMELVYEHNTDSNIEENKGNEHTEV